MDTKERVGDLLKQYHETKQALDIFKYQIETFTWISYDEGIEGLTFTKPEGDRVQNNSVSDKSARIALIYRDVADKQNEEILREMLKRYCEQKNELDMLEYCIRQLEPRLSEIITDMVMNKMPWDEMCDKYHVSQPMLLKYRKKAVDEITKIFNLLTVK